SRRVRIPMSEIRRPISLGSQSMRGGRVPEWDDSELRPHLCTANTLPKLLRYTTSAAVITSVPTVPLNSANARHHAPFQSFAVAKVAAKNQKYADPCHTSWNPVFHFAGPIAAITTPRRAAA